MAPGLTSISGVVVGSIMVSSAPAAGLGHFDNLQSDQLDLGATVLQHLLSRGQHLILDNDNTSRRGQQSQLKTRESSAQHVEEHQGTSGNRNGRKQVWKPNVNIRLRVTLQFSHLRVILLLDE